MRRCTHCGGEHLAEHWERCLDCGAALPSAPSKPLLANPVVGGMGPDFWELNLPQGGMLVIGPEGVDFFRDRESYDRDVGYHPDDSLMFANAEADVSRASRDNVRPLVGTPNQKGG